MIGENCVMIGDDGGSARFWVLAEIEQKKDDGSKQFATLNATFDNI